MGHSPFRDQAAAQPYYCEHPAMQERFRLHRVIVIIPDLAPEYNTAHVKNWWQNGYRPR